MPKNMGESRKNSGEQGERVSLLKKERDLFTRKLQNKKRELRLAQGCRSERQSLFRQASEGDKKESLRSRMIDAEVACRILTAEIEGLERHIEYMVGVIEEYKLNSIY